MGQATQLGGASSAATGGALATLIVFFVPIVGLNDGTAPAASLPPVGPSAGTVAVTPAAVSSSPGTNTILAPTIVRIS